MRVRPPVVFDHLDLLEWQLCRRLAGLSVYRPWLALLKLASKLGDWPLWVGLILAQPLLQAAGSPRRIIQYTTTALIAIAVYRLLKTRLCRERPFITFTGSIPCSEPARDRYSFPSGHTMHAVMFCVLSASHAPWLVPWLAPWAVLIALSRVGLGLHYLSDVIAGGLIGAAFALTSLQVAG
ncbi:phosphatase PAP2 family protein [Halomonas cerina]|uniref:undecaprenyl-diphosphate phosphatase n=1 Tax=Halomonas cerina TaxID=447424 RepID=A0A839VAB5_9GAMM|nr:phosphatase PAP2 family protein [Halomonas cerina]MBB3192563.1 undecaprenyl-diphosphatase [Halomonas cerina]